MNYRTFSAIFRFFALEASVGTGQKLVQCDSSILRSLCLCLLARDFLLLFDTFDTFDTFVVFNDEVSLFIVDEFTKVESFEVTPFSASVGIFYVQVSHMNKLI